MKLRPYQERIVGAVIAGFQKWKRQLVVCPTGGGKTICFARLAAMSHGRTLILAHREELIDQAIDKIKVAEGLTAGKEKAGDYASQDAKIVVASVQTMIRRLDRWPRDHFNLLVADEAHHSISPTWQRVLNHFDGAHVVGVTATPDRGDARELGEFYEGISAEVTLPELIRAGYLSKIMVQSVPLSVDLNKVRSKAGDFDERGVADALEPLLPYIAQAIKKHTYGRRTLVFVPLIATSKNFVGALRNEGLTAEHISGQSSDRKEILERFREWDFEVLSNAMLLTEGFDDPEIDCVVVLRPTRSRPLFAQMIGRGTRPAPLKTDLLLLDFLWLHERHKIVTPSFLVACNPEEAEEMDKVSKASGSPLDLDTIKGKAQAQREANLKKEIEKHGRRKGKLIDVLEWSILQAEGDQREIMLEIADFQPVFKWEGEVPTEKQLAFLRRNGIDPASVRSKGQASKAIDFLIKRSEIDLASPKQRALMRRAGYPDADNATKADARKFFAGQRSENVPF